MTRCPLTVAAALAMVGAAVADEVISLDGTWRLDYFPQPEAGAIRQVPVGVPCKTVKATVPGNCEHDLVVAGVLPNPQVGMNAIKLRPYEGYQWLYTKTIAVRKLTADEKAVVMFGGIDTLADVFVNGRKVGESANMLIEREFDITSALRVGDNTVQVLIRSIAMAARDESVGVLGHFTGCGADGEPFRKAFHMGGWDILPRVYAAGLWRPVSLEIRGPNRIDEVAWIVKDFNLKRKTADVNCTCRIRAPFAQIEHAKVRYTLTRDGKTAFETIRPLHFFHNFITFRLKDAAFWWPRGAGDPARYEARIELLGEDGARLAEDVRMIGIRFVELIRRDVTKDDPGEFLIKVNGEPTFIRGTNWVPLDSFNGCAGELLPKVLPMLADLNCNMVRVWGGGVYEADAFYDWCDENGVMVWQDFMTGCAVFPQNDAYAAATRAEVLAVVKRLRNHPALAIWSGNNENDAFHKARVGWRLAPDPNDDRLSRQVIPAVLREYDPSRPYLPSSPYYSRAVIAGTAKASELHLWGGCAPYKSPFYTNSVAHFVSETGYHGCPARTTLEAMMTPANVYPWKSDDLVNSWNEEWRFKATTPFMDPLMQPVLWNRPNQIGIPVREMFGGVPRDLDTFVAASQMLQAEALKHFVEMHRSRKFDRSTGLMWWNLRDGWPVVSDAVVDYYNTKKLAYWTIRNSQRDQIVMIAEDGTLMAINDARRVVEGAVTVRDAATGKIVATKNRFAIPANGKVALGKVGWQDRGVLILEATLDGHPYVNHYLYGERPFDYATLSKLIPYNREK